MNLYKLDNNYIWVQNSRSKIRHAVRVRLFFTNMEIVSYLHFLPALLSSLQVDIHPRESGQLYFSHCINNAEVVSSRGKFMLET